VSAEQGQAFDDIGAAELAVLGSWALDAESLPVEMRPPPQSPCVLDERQLGPVTDKDPEWRNAAVFTHEEVETIISDARIPPDRQMVYGPGRPQRCAGDTTIRRCAPSASCSCEVLQHAAGENPTEVDFNAGEVGRER
jgi:hypothetical protein